MPESRDAGLKCGAKCVTLSLSKCMPEMWDGVVRILEGSYAKIVPKTKRESCAVCYAKCVPDMILGCGLRFWMDTSKFGGKLWGMHSPKKNVYL